MINKSSKKIILLLALIILLVGIVSATGVNKTIHTDNDNKITDDVSTKNVKQSTKVIQKNEKKIGKTAITKKTYNVSTYKALKKALTANYDKITINLRANIKLQANTVIGDNRIYYINGNNKIIDGANKYQFLDIGKSNVTIKKLKIKNCHSSYGGAIKNSEGKLIIADSTFYNNTAKSGGAISNHEYIYMKNTTILSSKATEIGGAIKNEGNLIIGNSTLKNNKALEEGAVYNQMKLYMKNVVFINNKGALSNDNQATIIQCKINNNTSKDGAICNSNKLTITKSTINYNKATNYCAAINNNGGKVTITDSKINSNTAPGVAISNNGGVLNMKRSTVSNNKAQAISGDNKIVIYNCTINGNNKGAILSSGIMTINKTMINNNKNEFAEAIMNWGQMTLTNSKINNNKATGREDATGAISNYDTGKLTINKCTINGNTATEGGAIMNAGKLTVNSCTISNNKAKYGGALYNAKHGVTTLNNCKLLYNTPGGKNTIYIRSGKVIKRNTTIK